MTEIRKTPEDKSKDAKSTAEAAELTDEQMEQVAGGNTDKFKQILDNEVDKVVN